MNPMHIVCFIFVFNDNCMQLFITNADTQIWKKSLFFKKLKLHKKSLITIQFRYFHTFSLKEKPWMINSKRFDYHLTIQIFCYFFLFTSMHQLYLHLCDSYKRQIMEFIIILQVFKFVKLKFHGHGMKEKIKQRVSKELSRLFCDNRLT